MTCPGAAAVIETLEPPPPLPSEPPPEGIELPPAVQPPPQRSKEEITAEFHELLSEKGVSF